jgi:hypothetical protein
LSAENRKRISLNPQVLGNLFHRLEKSPARLAICHLSPSGERCYGV